MISEQERCLPLSNAAQKVSTKDTLPHQPPASVSKSHDHASLGSIKTLNPRARARLEEGRRVVLEAQLAAHGPHVRRCAPQLVPRQVRVQVVPAAHMPHPI